MHFVETMTSIFVFFSLRVSLGMRVTWGVFLLGYYARENASEHQRATVMTRHYCHLSRYLSFTEVLTYTGVLNDIENQVSKRKPTLNPFLVNLVLGVQFTATDQFEIERK